MTDEANVLQNEAKMAAKAMLTAMSRVVELQRQMQEIEKEIRQEIEKASINRELCESLQIRLNALLQKT